MVSVRTLHEASLVVAASLRCNANKALYLKGFCAFCKTAFQAKKVYD
jgi:hypothetical protein